MRRLAVMVGLVAGLAAGARPTPARADVLDDQPAIIGAVTIGTLAGITTSIAAIVYSVRGRSFHTPWVAVSMFSIAVTGSMTVALMADGVQSSLTGWHVLGALFFAAHTVWPGYYVIKSAISPVEPGAPFDAPPAAAWAPAPTQDPFTALSRPPTPTAPAALALTLPF